MNTLERRMEIIDILSVRKKEKVVNLAFEFNVSEKTIRNDICELSLSYPIDTKKGKGGCIFVQEGFSLRRRFLTDKEKALLEKIALNLSDEEAAVLQTIVKSFSKNNKRREG